MRHQAEIDAYAAAYRAVNNKECPKIAIWTTAGGWYFFPDSNRKFRISELKEWTKVLAERLARNSAETGAIDF